MSPRALRAQSDLRDLADVLRVNPRYVRARILRALATQVLLDEWLRPPAAEAVTTMTQAGHAPWFPTGALAVVLGLATLACACAQVMQ